LLDHLIQTADGVSWAYHGETLIVAGGDGTGSLPHPVVSSLHTHDFPPLRAVAVLSYMVI